MMQVEQVMQRSQNVCCFSKSRYMFLEPKIQEAGHDAAAPPASAPLSLS